METLRDEIGNILIRKPATPGMEKRKPVILQAHMDMVPQKNSNISHNFETDPIHAFVDGDWVRAQETTLGADNGIGLAAALTVLQSDNIAHPALEVLVTVDEETGMYGAFGLKPNFLKGEILLNLDSKMTENYIVGCAADWMRYSF
jgi:dipeptidase D